MYRAVSRSRCVNDRLLLRPSIELKMYATALVVLAAAATAIVGRPSKGVPHLPVLNQIPRSDWLNAKEGCNTSQLVKAKGDGKTDDTFALQLCFDAMSASKPNSTVYIPPGNYVIKNTLVLKKVLGGTIIGHGEVSFLFLLHSIYNILNGLLQNERVRLVGCTERSCHAWGFTLDGAPKARRR